MILVITSCGCDVSPLHTIRSGEQKNQRHEWGQEIELLSKNAIFPFSPCICVCINNKNIYTGAYNQSTRWWVDRKGVNKKTKIKETQALNSQTFHHHSLPNSAANPDSSHPSTPSRCCLSPLKLCPRPQSRWSHRGADNFCSWPLCIQVRAARSPSFGRDLGCPVGWSLGTGHCSDYRSSPLQSRHR